MRRQEAGEDWIENDRERREQEEGKIM